MRRDLGEKVERTVFVELRKVMGKLQVSKNVHGGFVLYFKMSVITP